MGRPKKQIVDYFPHDTDASDSRILTVLQNKYGNNGYAFWFKLKELLGRTPGHYYNFRDGDDWEFLLAKTHISEPETARRILDTLAILKAIDPELHQQGIIWSQEFVDSVEIVYKKRNENKPERPNSVEKTPLNGTESIVSGVGNPHSIVKYSILPPEGGQRKAQSSTKEKKDSVINELFSEMRRFLGYPEDKVCGPGSPTPGEKKEAKVCGGEAVPAIEESSAGDAHSKREKGAIDPIPNYGKEGKAIKRMLTRGFTREEILACWKGKVSQRGGEFTSMTWVNEDIGKTGKQKRRLRELSTEEEIAASIKEVAS